MRDRNSKKKAIFRRTTLLSKVKQEESYLTVDFYHEKGHKIDYICTILGLNRSSYYKWKKRVQPKKEVQDQELCSLIIEYDASYRHILGYRRMRLFINRFNHTTYSVKYIHRLMRHLNIKSVIRRKRYNYIKTKPEQIGTNLLNRDFTANHKNEKWLTDVTEFKAIGCKQKLYLSAIIDLYDTSVIAYKMGVYNNNQLAHDTFNEAIKKYPDAKPIFHSDRGFQYTSKIFKARLDEQGMIQSMSRVGKCIDNGPMEAFWGTLKTEEYYLNKYYSLESLKEAIDKYIEFYNTKRIQAKLKSLTPLEYRSQALIA
ncbi:MAG: IS3 family transposase [Bacilli bacterium]